MKDASNPLGRRQFLFQVAAGAAGTAICSADMPSKKRILLRSSWQTVNIGDIAHTPGMLHLLETHLPDVEVTLWPQNVGDGVEQLLRDRFPRLTIIKDEDALSEAFKTCALFLHGSKASVGVGDIERWRRATDKPYGIYGVTFPRRASTSTEDLTQRELARAVEAASGARFVYFRDSKSLAFARRCGVSSPVMEFGPDAAFACDLRDPERAEAFLARHGLESGKYLCCIPRLRFTPYWRLSGDEPDLRRHARNEQMKEHDHAPLRQAIIQVVERTDLKILVCPEDRTQMAVGKEMIVDRLPEEIRRRVVWRPDFWLTGEAISTYVRSAGLFGNEMHSPIMCIGHGVPAIVCRWAEQTTKGFMWQDIGLGQWLFDLDNDADVVRLPLAVLDMAMNADDAQAKAAKARDLVQRRQREAMVRLSSELRKEG